MADYKITVDVDTPEEAEQMMNKIQAILADIIEGGRAAGEEYAKNIIPKRTGRLAAGTTLEGGGGSFRLTNDVYYGIFVDKGHMTPSAFRGHPAKHRSHVAGKFFSEKVWLFVQDDINERCMALLDLK
jgi:hypothetical protein